jgi:hypothetical protein
MNDTEAKSTFNCKKLAYLYKYAQSSNINNEEIMKYFYTLDDTSIVEMLNLRLNHKINDKLMPYLIMAYTSDRGVAINKHFNKKLINNLLAESWFSYFYENEAFKNDLFILVPIFTSDLMSRIVSVLPEKNIIDDFYIDLLCYSRSFMAMIDDGSFYSIFNEQRKSEIGAVFEIEGDVYFSDFVKNSIELFYFSCYLLMEFNLEDISMSKKDLSIRTESYLKVVSINNFYEKKTINKIKDTTEASNIQTKNKNIREDVNGGDVDVEGENSYITATIKELASKFINARKKNKHENGAYECKDGSFRKPTQGNQLIISKKNSSNTFSLIFLTLTVFTILGTFTLSYADSKDSYFNPIKNAKITTDLSSIVQSNLSIETLN